MVKVVLVALALLAHGAHGLRLMASPEPQELKETQQEAALEDSTGNWCKLDCLTKFEKKYLEENKDNENLQKALEVLRKPGCVAKGQKIITGGIFRSGSTLLYNQARLWMSLAFPGDASAGYAPSHDQFEAPASAVVLKLHMIDEWHANHSDKLLMSHRSVGETILSRMGSKMSNPTEKELAEKVEKECTGLMTQQTGAYKAWEKIGKKVSYDVLLSDFEEKQRREIENIARGLGVCAEASKNQELHALVQAMAKHLIDNEGDAGLITQMHKAHAENYELAPAVEKHIKQIPQCNEWAAKNGNPEYNAELIKQRAFVHQ